MAEIYKSAPLYLIPIRVPFSINTDRRLLLGRTSRHRGYFNELRRSKAACVVDLATPGALRCKDGLQEMEEEMCFSHLYCD